MSLCADLMFYENKIKECIDSTMMPVEKYNSISTNINKDIADKWVTAVKLEENIKKYADEIFPSYDTDVFDGKLNDAMMYLNSLLNYILTKNVVQIHLYSFENVLRPRGSMKKESLGLEIFEKLKEAYDSWTNPKYGDNPSIDFLIDKLRANLDEEVEAGWKKFLEEICKNE